MPLYRKQIVTQSSSPSLSLPPTVKTTAKNDDFFIGIDENSELYRIKKSDLLAGLSSGGTGGTTAPTTTTLSFQSFGDDKGVLYYLGATGRDTWANPSLIGTIELISIGTLFPSIPLSTICDRQQGNYHTVQGGGGWVQIDLLEKKLKLNYWSYRARFDAVDHIPSKLIVSGSDDGVIFTELSNKSFSVAPNNWVGYTVVTQNIYRYIRFTAPLSEYFTIGEIEIYGILS